MMTNTQGIYKVKKVLRDKEFYYEKAKLFFEDVLEKHRSVFTDLEEGESVFEHLVKNSNLFFLDYPEIRRSEANRLSSERYRRRMTSISGNQFDAYLEIPFAIFAKVKNFAREGEEDFLCLAAIFNDTFFKDRK